MSEVLPMLALFLWILDRIKEHSERNEFNAIED